jgi:hypothetical protein
MPIPKLIDLLYGSNGNRLNEAFDNPYPVKKLMDTGTEKSWEFTTNAGTDYVIIITKHSSGDDEWRASFKLKGAATNPYGVTGSGDEMRVFATVIRTVMGWVSRHKPNELDFSADASRGKASRVRLYRTLLNRYAPDGYETGSRGSGFFSVLTLTKRGYN